VNCDAVSLLITHALSMDLNIKFKEDGDFFSNYVTSDAPMQTTQLHHQKCEKVVLWKDGRKIIHVIKLWTT